MRSLDRKKQDVWFCEFEEVNVGMNRAKIFHKPIKYHLTVSATSGSVAGWGSGISLRYDRDITSYNTKMRGIVREGMAVFVDVKPVLDKDGELVVNYEYLRDEDGNIILDEDDEPIITKITYDSQPDYIVERIYDTQKGVVIRYAIKKV